ncbi:MAG: hypothetical protein Q8M15_14000 [Bacteroidota bacterium]|nr:hypothetical protein [Bacteroidota bacterium]
MKKLIFICSMVFVVLTFLEYPITGKEYLTASSNQINLKTSGLASTDTIIRLMDDRVGIGYFKNGIAVLDNIDALHFVYIDEVEHANFTMGNFKIEGPYGHYYLTMDGNYSNKLLKIAFPCFGDIAGIKNEFPLNFDNNMNTCLGESGSNCNFIKNEEHNIVGVSSICKHAVTRNGGADFYRKYILDYNKYPTYGSY